MSQRKHKFNPLYKNFLKLKVNPMNNNKFLKFKVETKTIINKYNKKKIEIKRYQLTKKSQKKKWALFLEQQIKAQKFYNRFKPYTFYTYKTSKFASQGNSFKKKFKNNLLARTTFNYLYGGLSKKYLKDKMTSIYQSKKLKDSLRTCVEFFESRLDSVLYRSKFCSSMRSARQLIAHKHVKINNRIEKNKSYILKKGDLITLGSSSMKITKENLNKEFKNRPDFIMWPMPPHYLTINYNTLEIIMGEIKNFNFSNSFTFKVDMPSIITSNYRD